MRPRRFALVAPLLLLAACTGNPETQSAPTVSRTNVREPAQVAALPGGLVSEPSRLKGLNPVQVKSVLGKPVFTRRDAPAEIWSYRGRACTLDVFLYDEGQSQTVAHYAVRSPQPVSEKDCLGELVGQGTSIPAG